MKCTHDIYVRPGFSLGSETYAKDQDIGYHIFSDKFLERRWQYKSDFEECAEYAEYAE